MGPAALGVFLKNPVPGFVKSRLAREIGAGPAAAIYRECACASLTAAARWREEPVTVFYSPPDARRTVVRFVRRRFPNLALRFVPAGRGSLGTLIARAFRVLAAPDTGPGIVIGTDAPSLPRSYLRRAAASLARYDCVIGPTLDGGFCLIGVTSPRAGLFRRVEWSSGREFAQVRRNARRLGLRTKILPRWYDVDRADDLLRLLRWRNASAGFRRLIKAALRERRA